MNSNGEFIVNSRTFQWVVGEYEEYPGLPTPYRIPFGVLRISSIDRSFDIAVRSQVSLYAYNVELTWLGPLLVLGKAFPNPQKPIRPGTLLLLRPKLTLVKHGIFINSVAERIVQWSMSKRFRPLISNHMGMRSSKVYEYD